MSDQNLSDLNNNWEIIEKCDRCKGIGVTLWDAFVAGLGNLIGALMGDPIRGFCSKCNGTGKIRKIFGPDKGKS